MNKNNMEENKIPTAEEFVKEFRKKNPIANAESIEHWIAEHCIEFSKLHVEAALKAASESKSLCTAYTDDGLDYKENILCKESVLNAYPLENIK